MIQRSGEFNPRFLDNPYPLYDRLRSRSPLYWYEPHQAWILTRFADVAAVLRAAHASANRLAMVQARRSEELQQELQPLFDSVSRQLLFIDPPAHTRIRGLVVKAFTPRIVEQMRNQIEQTVDRLLDGAEQTGEIDLLRDFAYPLPAIVLLGMMGLPVDERDRFKAWSDAFAGFLGNFQADPHIDRQAQRSVQQAAAFLRSIRPAERAERRDNLLRQLIEAEEEGEALSEEELLANAFLLMVAGHETTTNLIGNGMLALLRHPEQWERLRADPALIGTAVEELLRYDSPVQSTARRLTQDTAFGDRTLPAGSLVSLTIGAANRDPDQFEQPHRLDLGRRDNRHLAFGFGAHFCLGAPLARLEGQIAIGALVRRFPQMRLAASDVRWRANLTLRGLASLPVLLK